MEKGSTWWAVLNVLWPLCRKGQLWPTRLTSDHFPLTRPGNSSEESGPDERWRILLGSNNALIDKEHWYSLSVSFLSGDVKQVLFVFDTSVPGIGQCQAYSSSLRYSQEASVTAPPTFLLFIYLF